MMDDILSPIATIDMDEYNESFFNYCATLDIYDDLNGNTEDSAVMGDYKGGCMPLSLQASLEDLVNNFDSVISECFYSDEKIDTMSPISDRYKSCNTLVDKNQIWLSLTGSVTMALNLDWRSFKSYEEFRHAIHVTKHEDTINQNLDLPDDEELASAMDHHSLVASSIPSDYEPLKTADEVIQEIDKIMGISNDEYNSGDMTSNLDCSDFIGSEEAFILRRSVLSRSDGWFNDLDTMSTMELNNVLDELEESIRDFSSLLIEELAQREDLEYEKEQRDLFVKLLHDIGYRQTHKQEEVKPKKLSLISLDEASFEEISPKRSNSWKSIFSYGKKDHMSSPDFAISRISKSSDNVNQNLGVSIPIHKDMQLQKDVLEIFNHLLQAMITSPSQFNKLLTDYILNVYAPADDVSMSMSLDML